MGTADTASSFVSENSGIIQRAVKDLFIKMAEDDSVTYETTVSFLEVCKIHSFLYFYTPFNSKLQLLTFIPFFSFSLQKLYMEKVFDLLSKTRNEEVEIREDAKGIKINGLTEAPVKSCEDTLKCLEQGSHNRRTGATAMNNQSSRSHAVFTLTITQVKL
jgi:kinesin family protein 4/21/27